MGRLSTAAEFVVGVAESTKLPAVYPSLVDANEQFLPIKSEPIGSAKLFCLGSCQTNGWQAQLRAVLDLMVRINASSVKFSALEVDIVHPDTPTGRLGTKSIVARDQDPRNNLRPTFSQVETSMDRLFPQSNNVNTISLRTLILPPGFQICRFFFHYETKNGERLSHTKIVESFKITAKEFPSILRVTDYPLGSKAFEHVESAAVILPQSTLLRFYDDPFNLRDGAGLPLSELILQAYVHNTRGYCRSVIEALKYLLNAPNPKAFFPDK
jgi:hypothetical protein